MLDKLPYFIILYFLGLQSCVVPPNIKNSTFTHGIILSSSSWTVASAYHFEKNRYKIRTTDNTCGQMDYRITEEGEFYVHGHKLTLKPEIRLICPKSVPEWQVKDQLVYTDSLKTDSFYIFGIQRCYDFSDYIFVTKDTLSHDNAKLLGFTLKSFNISKKDGRFVLESLDFKDYYLSEYLSPDLSE